MKATVFGLSVLAVVFGGSARAQIATDGTVGPKMDLPGLHVEIPDALGTTKGGNLFHSFEKFNIATKGSATFTQTRSESIDNVISRVTGDAASKIDGLLESQIPGADFWFINPAGVMFGPNASINVPAAFHVSTADRISFDNGDFFSSALDTEGSMLSIAAPEAFGFLGSNPGSIKIDHTGWVEEDSQRRARLSVNDGKTLSLVGGNVSIDGGAVAAPGGRINLASTASPTEFGLADGFAESPSLGEIQLSNGAQVSTSGEGGGAIRIQGGKLVVDSSTLLADNTGSRNSTGGIEVSAKEVLLRDGGRMFVGSFGEGDAGNITIKADDRVAVHDNSEITTDTFADDDTGDAGDAGTIAIYAKEVEVAENSKILGSTQGGGNGGDILVETFRLVIAGSKEQANSLIQLFDQLGLVGLAIIALSNPPKTGILSEVTAGATGNAGKVTIDASQVEISTFGRISASTQGEGKGGDVSVKSDSLVIAGPDKLPEVLVEYFEDGRLTELLFVTLVDPLKTGILSDAGDRASDQAGSVEIKANFIDMHDAALVSSMTLGDANAGTMTVKPKDPHIRNFDAHIRDFSAISSASIFGSGAAGTVSVTAKHGALTVSDHSAITSDTFAGGNAGTVEVVIGRLASTNYGAISSGAFGTGNGGAVTVEADEALFRDFSGVFSDTFGSGNAGNVKVTVKSGVLEINDSAEISSDGGVGDGGKVTVEASAIEILGGVIAARTSGPGDGGAVKITADSDLVVREGGRIATTTSGTGMAGPITIDAARVVIDGKGSTITADTTATFAAFADLAVILDIAHAYDSDLVATLIGPSDKTATLFYRVGENGDNFAGTRLDDRAAIPIWQGSAPFSDTYRPDQPFEAFIGEPANGTWTLELVDKYPLEDPGTLRAWSLKLGDQVIQSSNVPLIVVGPEPVESQLLVNLGPDAKVAAFPAAKGGDVTINANNSLTILNGATVSAASEGTGSGGNIRITAPDVALANGGEISTISEKTGAAGNIFVARARELSMNNATITTEALQANGGQIDIRVADLIHLKDSVIATAVGGGEGDAGNIFIDPRFMVMDNSRIVADAKGGSGGNITIVAGQLFRSPNSVISATSRESVSGTITITAPETDVANAVAVAEPGFVDPSSLLAETCEARSGQPRSSLVRTGRGGLPEDPGRMLHATLIADQSPKDFESEGATGPDDPNLAFLDAGGLATLAKISAGACR